MYRRSSFIALVLLIASALLIIPVFFISVFFAIFTDVTFVYIGFGFLAGLGVLAIAISARRRSRRD
jgi:hypothetical protein